MTKSREHLDNENKRYETAIKAASKVLTQKTNNYILTGHLPGSKSAIHINGDNDTVNINATLVEVNGRDILKELDEMRDALLLLKRDVDMEAKYPKLRELKDEYEATLERYKTFERLK